VAKEFSQTFNGCRVKIGDIQLELTEDFVSEAIGLPSTNEKWFKNSKIEEVPWSLFMTSKKINCCKKGIHVSLVRRRWHGLLLILEQFVTCEGRYGFSPFIHSDLFLPFLPFKPKNVLSHPCYILVTFVMAPVVRLEPNGCQALLSHDDAIEDLKIQGWDAFLKRYEGCNLQVAKAFE